MNLRDILARLEKSSLAVFTVSDVRKNRRIGKKLGKRTKTNCFRKIAKI